MEKQVFYTKCFVLDLSRKTDKTLAIIFGHLTYSASKLWNVANRQLPPAYRSGGL
ncbi:MAG: hypothetical protein WBI01_07845 [Syntrophomonadaceae bacterium]